MATESANSTSMRRTSRRKPPRAQDGQGGDQQPMPTRRSGRPSVASRAKQEQDSESPAADSTGLTNRPWGRKGKAPLHPVDDEYDQVEEYDFSNELQDLEDTEDGESFDDDAKSVISLSSDVPAPEEVQYNKQTRPWLRFSDEQRKHWEVMYSNVTPYAIGGSWAITEEYQREKDEEMIEYLKDFPLPHWILPRHTARTAYEQLAERMRWRGFGIPIYGRDRVPVWPNDRPPANHVPPANGPHQPGRPAPQPPPQQHPMQHQPPPQLHFPQPGQPQSIPLQHIQYVPRTNGHPGHAPPNSLSSQPFVQPLQAIQQGPPPQLPPNGLGQPVGTPQEMAYRQPSYSHPGSSMTPVGVYMPPDHMQPKPRKPREKKETPAPGTPPPPPPTPPYAIRAKPYEPRKPVARPGRKTMRRQAEAEEFPWTRQLNFPEEKAKARWDDTIYEPETVREMAATRARNVRVIDDIDMKLQEQQRMARVNKKMREKAGGPAENSSDVENSAKKPERKKRGQPKGENPGDPYHSGAYAWADEVQEQKGKEMGFETPDQAIEAGENGDISLEQMGGLRIHWNPGKKGITEGLEQATFTVKDNVLTRKQLETTPILTRRAAECIIDYCPDMLWRGMLLRIASEAGYGNKDVRDRFCNNGCYCDKATITKRISAALGQKQIQPKAKGYQPGEFEWYDENVRDFTHYIEYFGARTSHRNMLKIQMAGDKRRALERQKNQTGESGNEGEGSSKRLKSEGTATSEAEGNNGGDDDDSGEESDDSNAVSLQDSDILDKMEDD